MTNLMLLVEPDYQSGKSVVNVLNQLAEKCQDQNDLLRPTGQLDALVLVVSDNSLNGLNQRLTEINQVFKLPAMLDIAEKTRLNLVLNDTKRFIKVAPKPMHFVRGAMVESLSRLTFDKSDIEAKDRAVNATALSERLTNLASKKTAYESGLSAPSESVSLPVEMVFFANQNLSQIAQSLLNLSLADKPHAMGLLFMGEAGSLDELNGVINATG